MSPVPSPQILKLGAKVSVLAEQLLLFHRLVDRLENDHPFERLGDEIGGALAHRLDGGLHRAEPRYQEHLRLGKPARELFEEGDSVHPGHSQIRDHDIRGILFEELDSGFRIVGGRHPESLLGNHFLQRLAASPLVVHHQDMNFARRPHTLASWRAAGKKMRNVVPSASWLANRMVPRCSWMICCARARPSPVPFAFVVKKGVKREA